MVEKLYRLLILTTKNLAFYPLQFPQSLKKNCFSETDINIG